MEDARMVTQATLLEDSIAHVSFHTILTSSFNNSDIFRHCGRGIGKVDTQAFVQKTGQFLLKSVQELNESQPYVEYSSRESDQEFSDSRTISISR
jgi:hypothetical protein